MAKVGMTPIEALLADYGMEANRDEWVQGLVDELQARMADAWLGGWYTATNGKWGDPEPGQNPYGDVV